MISVEPSVAPATLRETTVDQTRRVPANVRSRGGFSSVFADHAVAARVWFLTACAAVAFSLIQPYLILKLQKTRERVVVLDGAGSFAVSPVLGFEEAKELHEAMTMWATLALFQRNPRDFDYPEILQK